VVGPPISASGAYCLKARYFGAVAGSWSCHSSAPQEPHLLLRGYVGKGHEDASSLIGSQMESPVSTEAGQACRAFTKDVSRTDQVAVRAGYSTGGSTYRWHYDMQLSVPSQLWKLAAVTGRASDDDVLFRVRPC